MLQIKVSNASLTKSPDQNSYECRCGLTTKPEDSLVVVSCLQNGVLTDVRHHSGHCHDAQEGPEDHGIEEIQVTGKLNDGLLLIVSFT